MSSFYQFLSEKQEKSEIPLFGFAPVSEWENETKYPVSSDFFPTNIFPEAETAIVIGVPVTLPIIETTPSVYYNEHYHTLNAYLDAEALKLSFFLNRHSMPAVPVPRDGYAGIAALKRNPKAAFSHKHAAYHAGLGAFGRNNVLLTAEYGPRVRFTTILTSASADDLGIPGSVLSKKSGTKNQTLCINCMACARLCPAGAVSNDKNKPYPVSRIDKTKCTDYSGDLGLKGISPCGVCIKVCPVGKDRTLYNRKNIQIYTKNVSDSVNNQKIVDSWEHIRRYGTK